jgi:hypothetical protein
MRGRAVVTWSSTRRALALLPAFTTLAGFAGFGTLAGCGETRRPIGDECLRDDDCLSAVCAARSCVSAPPLVVGASPAPPEEELRIPEADAASSTPSTPPDAGAEGG